MNAISRPEHVKRRRILVTATLPLVALLAIIALKLLLMMLFGHLAVVFTAAGNYELAATVSKWNLVANVVEVHKAHYNLGTAYLGMELYDDSIDELLEALDTAPVPDSCWVRTNLSLAYEGLGDQQTAAGDPADAVYSYLVGENVLAGADPACASQSSSSSDDSDDQSDSGGGGGDDQQDQGGGDQQNQGGGTDQQDQGTFGEQSAESQQRLDDKASDAQDQVDEQAGSGGQSTDPNQGDPGDGDGDQPQNTNPFDELGEQMEQAQQQAESSNGEDRGESGGFAIPDRPW